MNENNRCGSWVRKKCLGRGAFGAVWLWHNEETNVKLAIKECLHDRTRQMWNAELSIMKRLQHDNLIQSMPVPPELTPASSELSVLAMEFCEGGDLRKALNRPENCFGLSEIEIRQLTTGVGSALEYLHSNSISHRDLKPENIVLKPLQGRIIYKIIDYGYAKELETSMMESHVGTIKYLAPELFTGKPYNMRVDYWSFGVVTFECITGFRPFLPTTPAVQWHSEVSKKSPEDISAQYNEDDKVVFSKHLPSRNHLCRPLRDYFEQWLRLMLRWNPKARGELNGISCFDYLQQFMNLKIFTMLHVETNTLLSYPVADEHTIKDVMDATETRTGIPPDEQRIVHASGVTLSCADLAAKGCAHSLSDELKVFLFREGPLQVQERESSNLPPYVNTIVKEPAVILPGRDHRRAWAESVYWFEEENRNYYRLILAHRAALLNLMRDQSVLLRHKTELEEEARQLSTCKEFFKDSLDFDINKCKEAIEVSEELSQSGGQRLVDHWQMTEQHVEAAANLVQKSQSLSEEITSLSAKVTDLQRGPEGMQVHANELKEFEEKSKDLYERLIEAYRDDLADEFLEHKPMVELVARCFLKKNELTKTLYTHINAVREYQSKFEAAFGQVEKTLLEVRESREVIKLLQRQRQETLWSLIRNPQHQQGTGAAELTSFSTFNMAPITSNLESLQLFSDCKDHARRSKIILEEILKEQEQSIQYFSSMDSNK